MRNSRISTALSGVGLLFVVSSALAAPDPEPPPVEGESAEAAGGPGQGLDELPWVREGTVPLGSRAELDVPNTYRFAGPELSITLLEAMGNMPNPGTLGMIGPEDLDWFAIYEFMNEGYIEDASQDDLDADELLSDLRAGARNANEVRRERNLATVVIDGWAVPPTFNEQTKVLEWATLATFTEPDGSTSQSINFFTKVLGRKGYMDVVVVCGPEELDATLPAFRSMMTGFRFADGERYDQYQPGDKIAQYGLAALVVGGATAVAAKTGLFAGLLLFLKKGAKFIIIGIAAVGAWIARLFGGRKNG